jgi:hypothetical protein
MNNYSRLTKRARFYKSSGSYYRWKTNNHCKKEPYKIAIKEIILIYFEPNDMEVLNGNTTS